MSNARNKRGRITASDLFAELAQSEKYQREEAEREQLLEGRRRSYEIAEIPIVSDLRAAGIVAGSVWDFVNRADPYPEALPILLKHLEIGGYPDQVMEGLGRALAVGPMNANWGQLRSLYERSRSKAEATGLAVALAASAGEQEVDQLMDLISDNRRGEERILFVVPILRVGGVEGKQFLYGFRADPLLGPEVREKLRL